MSDASWGPVTVRDTPWDAAVFGVATGEVRLGEGPWASEAERETALHAALAEVTASGRYDLLYGRVTPDPAVVRALRRVGFSACETQVVYGLSARRWQPPAAGAAGLAVHAATPADVPDVVAASQGMFRYSRFHEDPDIPGPLADARMVGWVRDLAAREAPLLVARSSAGALIGFMFCTTGPTAELTLGGCTPAASFLAPRFWAGVVEAVFQRGARAITAAVSAANVPMMRVYGDLQFNAVRSGVDYHWHRPGRVFGAAG